MDINRHDHMVENLNGRSIENKNPNRMDKFTDILFAIATEFLVGAKMAIYICS